MAVTTNNKEHVQSRLAGAHKPLMGGDMDRLKENTHCAVSRWRTVGESGFSIIELCVVLTIMAIIASVALPDFSELAGSFNRQNALNQVEFDMRRARSEALSNGTRGIVSFSDAGSIYSYGFDYVPYANSPIAETEEFRRVLPNKVTFSSDIPIIFDSRGYLIDTSGDLTTATLTLSFDGSSFCSGSLYSTGTISFDCK